MYIIKYKFKAETKVEASMLNHQLRHHKPPLTWAQIFL